MNKNQGISVRVMEYNSTKNINQNIIKHLLELNVQKYLESVSKSL